MKKSIGPVRVASWGHTWLEGVRGWAISWNGKGLLLSLELHYENRRNYA